MLCNANVSTREIHLPNSIRDSGLGVSSDAPLPSLRATYATLTSASLDTHPTRPDMYRYLADLRD